LGLVPPSTSAVVTVDWPGVTSNPVLRDAFDVARTESLLASAAYASLDVARIVVFDVATPPEGSAAITLVRSRGALDHKPRLQSRGWTVDVATAPPLLSNGSGLWWSEAEGWGLLGSRAAVIAVLRSRRHPVRFTDRTGARAVIGRLPTQGAIQLYFAPDSATVDAAEFTRDVASASLGFTAFWPLRSLVQRLGMPVGFGADLSALGDDRSQVHMIAAMRDEAQASFVAGGFKVVQGLSALGDWARQLEPSLKDVPSPTIDVSRDKTIVSIRMTVPAPRARPR
jgi:hypothetical protein